MYQKTKEASYQISLQNIQYDSKHVYSGVEILLVIKGEIEVKVNGQNERLIENHLLLINANHVYSIKGSKENVVLSLYIPFHVIEPHYVHIQESHFDCNSSKADSGLHMLYEQIRQMMAEMVLSHYQKKDGYELEINSFIYRLFTLLIHNFKTTYFGEKPGDIEDERISDILVFIERNYHKPITLQSVAQQQYLSIHYLSRYFKQIVGVSFSQYVRQIRLKYALHELVSTDRQIVRIALNNGFPSVKAFNKAFKEMYKQTPSEYRSFHKQEEAFIQEIDSGSKQYTPVNSTDVLMELGKYISQKDDLFTNTESVTSYVNIELPKKPISVMNQTSRLLMIGQLEYALQEEVQEELKLVQEVLHFEYVYFNDLFSESIMKNIRLFHNRGKFYHIDTLFSYFQKLGLVPFISVHVESEIERNLDYFERLNEFLQHSAGYFEKEFIEKWQFEVVYHDWNVDTEQSFHSTYDRFYQTVKKWLPRVKIGLNVPFSLEKGIPHSFKECLKRYQNKVDLTCYTCNPNQQLDFTDMNNESFEGVKDFLKKTCINLKSDLMSIGLTNIPIYLTNWNTLHGNTVNLSGSFFRSALIFKDMFEMMKEVSGLGFWIDTDSLESNNRYLEKMNGIPLFYYFQIKRPAFFNLQLAEKLGLELLAEGDGFVLTNNKQGYQLVMYNPTYMNPSYSVENFFLNSLTKEMKIIISGLPTGHYQIRKHILDKDNGAFYHNWLNLPDQDIYDEEIITFLKQRTYPDLKIYEKYIDSPFFFQSTLTLNAVHLFEIRPLHS